MFEDDLFHPNNVDDVVLDTVRRNAKNPGIGGGVGGQKTHECQVPGYDTKGKKTTVKCYTSSGLIRDAVTGKLTNKVVGSRDEYEFFKVRYPGIGTFFFRTPSDYEQHFNSLLTDDIKEKWRN